MLNGFAMFLTMSLEEVQQDVSQLVEKEFSVGGGQVAKTNSFFYSQRSTFSRSKKNNGKLRRTVRWRALFSIAGENPQLRGVI